MKRTAVLFAASALLGGLVAGHALTDAEAVAPAQVIGAYRLKLKGDGWLRGTTEPYRVERVNGFATLFLGQATDQSGKVHVTIQLAPELTGSLVDLATPQIAFVGDAFMVGDSLTVIDTGAPTYVNALTLQFQKEGGKVTGTWISAFPPSAADSGAGSAVGIAVSGRRLRKGDPGVATPRPAALR